MTATSSSQALPDAEPIAEHRSLRRLIIAVAMMQLAIYAVFAAKGPEGFREAAREHDTNTYTVVAESLVCDGRLIASGRTLGYPLFLAVGYLLGGTNYAVHVTIAMQLGLNLVLTWGGWRLARRLLPEASSNVHLLAAALTACTGLGFSFAVLSDLPGAVAFFGFLYGMLFWRGRWAALLVGVMLFLATFIRPALTFYVVLIPPLAWVAGRVESRVPWTMTVAATLGSLTATGLSTLYQYRTLGFAGPSSDMAYSVREAVWYSTRMDRYPTFEQAEDAFYADAAQRLGVSRHEMTKTQELQLGRELLWEAFRERPLRMTWFCASNVVKTAFAPVEAFLRQPLASLLGREGAKAVTLRYFRPVLMLLWVPFWLMCYIPPIRAGSRSRWYYAAVLLTLAYILATTAILTRQGERYRTPIIPFLIPLGLRNLLDLRAWWKTRRVTQRTA